MSDLDDLLNKGEFAGRHLGSDEAAQRQMLETLKVGSLDALVREVVPAGILLKEPLALGEAMREPEALAQLSAHAMRNEVWRSFIGMGYHGTHTPAVIQRNVLENPGWYTAYTPYQAEISQGRLEGLLNFQQMVIDLTGLPVANASLLDEATAAAEAMAMIRRSAKSKAAAFFVDRAVHPQVLSVMRTRAKWLGIELIVGADVQPEKVFGAHLQYPDTFGRIRDFSEVIQKIHAAQGLVSMGTDLLALMLLRSPGAMGADVAIGSAQRFGVPMGFGGPHAAFMACRDEYKRSMPGRIIGVSVDAAGRPALRMALQTREQHIRRDKATSNICTAQALLANMAGFYAVYHGPRGLTRIALRANYMARLLAAHVHCESKSFFDTVVAKVSSVEAVRSRATAKRINLRYLDGARVAVSFDELTSLEDVADVAEAISSKKPVLGNLGVEPTSIPPQLRRSDAVLSHPVFNRYHTETEMMRYLKRLENRDLSLVHSMIPLGSCTMKLNAAAELLPVSWPRFAALHPFAPAAQVRGTLDMIRELEGMLAEVTGFAGVSLQPNSGAQGEYAGLLAIRDYLAAKGEGERDVCLIPASAHGTNPASAQMMGLRIVVVACDQNGNVDLADLEHKVAEHRARLAALMITYPSTHGVFEEAIVQICAAVHAAGGQVYMDGANLNALAGLAKPAQIGADVCHINLHKTFCIPHGGGGPGMGPIAVAAHLTPFLPRHPLEGDAVSAAPYGSALILPISWMYLRMMGAGGVRRATELAILNANYIAARLAPYFPVLYKGARGRVAHECILDLRKLKPSCGVSAEDVAKRLMDYGFHSPTLSFPVADTLMVEPTESESKEELDRFCDAMIAIHAEIEQIRGGAWDRADNPLKNAPHTALELAGDWKHPYSREQAAYPRPWLRAAKYWPPVKRIDNAAGDRNLICTCPPIE
ncbi:MAG TPA: aminomethyl-transferring glycine dehydrogenase, partial [Burkholderiales bacterium]|nr:aminomethyl-transferring glycine dehydrogenase [Burkholderiales bacterium]